MLINPPPQKKFRCFMKCDSHLENITDAKWKRSGSRMGKEGFICACGADRRVNKLWYLLRVMT